MALVRSFAAIAALAALTACSQTNNSTSSTYSAALVPTDQVLKICSGYGCIISNKVTFGASDLERLRDVMDAGQASPAQERDAVAKAVGLMEIMSRAKGRYAKDNPKAWQIDKGKRGQMDCVDESLNTGAYLRYLHRNGLLRHHAPERGYAERGLIIDGRYPHKSATMKDKAGTRWTVDSWYGATGDAAEIMTHAQWRRVRNGFNG